MSSRGAAAVAYAEHYGWRVLPIWWVRADGTCACGDAHLTTPANVGKHPITSLAPSGHLDATSEPGLVRMWWEVHPEANVALNCAGSKLVVIDVDPRHDGDATMAQLESQVQFPQTLRARTGGGGFHLFYSAPEGRVRGKLGPGVDVKHEGYVLLPPSNHVHGAYAWDTQGVGVSTLGDVEAYVRHGSRVSRSNVLGESEGWSAEVTRALSGAAAGDRHEAFKSLAARLRAKRFEYLEARYLVERAVEHADQSSHPFPLEEAIALLDWAWELPEGTSAEQELASHIGYLTWLGGNAVPGASSNGLGVPPQPGHGTQSPGTSANGSFDGLAVQERLLALPDGLREEAIKTFVRDQARTEVRHIRSEIEFTRPADGTTLAHIMSSPEPELEWTVAQLHERGTNTSLTAQYKAGKTTLQLNLIRALADQEPFLGTWAARTDRNVGFFNYELTNGTFRRWARRVGVVRADRVFVWNLRGHRLDLESSAARRWVIEQLLKNDISFWLADPLARAYYGDENDNTQLKLWTDAVDEIKREAGVTDFQVTLHTGRAEMVEGEERARGATRIDDWVDARWLMLRGLNGARFFRAVGREVEIEETRLHFDEESWRLSVDHAAPVSRQVHRELVGLERVLTALRVLGAVDELHAVNKSALRDAMTGAGHDRMRIIEIAASTGDIATVSAGGQRSLYYLPGFGGGFTGGGNSTEVLQNYGGTQPGFEGETL